MTVERLLHMWQMRSRHVCVHLQQVTFRRQTNPCQIFESILLSRMLLHSQLFLSFFDDDNRKRAVVSVAAKTSNYKSKSTA